MKLVVKTHNNFNKTAPLERPYFHMAKFDLFKLTSVVEVDTEYQELAGITNDEAEEVYDNLVNALYVYNNGGTAEELQAAYDALLPLYSAVNEKKNKVEYVRELNELIPATETLIKAIKDAQAAAVFMDWKAGLITDMEYAKSVGSTMEITQRSRDRDAR